MIMVNPISPTTTQLTSSTIAEPATGETVWTDVAFSQGDEVISTTTHRKYRALKAIANSSGFNPDNESYNLNGVGTNWSVIGNSLRYSMFDGRTSIQSTSTTPYTFSLTPNANVTALAAFNVTGATSINVTMVDGTTTVYNRDIQMRDDNVVDNWFDYYFEPIILVDRFVLLDLPVFPAAVITVTITGDSGATIGVGQLVYGSQVSLGVTQVGSSGQLLDFSRRELNFDGSFSVTRRRTADIMDYEFVYDTRRFGYIRSQLKATASIPTVFIGNPSDVNDGTAVFGYHSDVVTSYDAPEGISFGSLQVQETI